MPSAQVILSALLCLVFVKAQIQKAPADDAGRPWYFREISSQFIDGAVAIRSSNVPQQQASSVAKYIVDEGLSPSQFTELASLALGWVVKGNIPATSLAEEASIYASAYTSMHSKQEYSSFVSYVKANSKIFDIKRLIPSQRPAAGSGEARQARELESIYSSIVADPAGARAVQTFMQVNQQYAHDFGVQIPMTTFLANLVYSYIV